MRASPARPAAALAAALAALVLGAGCRGAAPSATPPTAATTPASAPPAPSFVAAQPSSPVTRLYSGRHSAYEAAAEVVVRDAAAWQATWARLRRGPAAESAPAVDFARDMIVVVALGERPSGGYAVRIDSVSAGSPGPVVHYTATEPGEGCMSTQALTAPVDAVQVPRVAGPARFTRRTVRTAC
jgi:hypothetical protein